MDNSKIQIYMGNGKGKSTAALGLMTRALGHGLKVMFISFCKGHESFISGEKIFLDNCKEYKDKFVFKRIGNSTNWESPNNINAGDVEQAITNWFYILNNYKNYDILIIDDLRRPLGAAS